MFWMKSRFFFFKSQKGSNSIDIFGLWWHQHCGKSPTRKKPCMNEGSIEGKTGKLGQRGGAIRNKRSRANVDAVTWMQNIACGGLSREVGLNNVIWGQSDRGNWHKETRKGRMEIIQEEGGGMVREAKDGDKHS